jgi:hypothetical protein
MPSVKGLSWTSPDPSRYGGTTHFARTRGGTRVTIVESADGECVLRHSGKPIYAGTRAACKNKANHLP